MMIAVSMLPLSYSLCPMVLVLAIPSGLPWCFQYSQCSYDACKTLSASKMHTLSAPMAIAVSGPPWCFLSMLQLCFQFSQCSLVLAVLSLLPRCLLSVLPWCLQYVHCCHGACNSLIAITVLTLSAAMVIAIISVLPLYFQYSECSRCACSVLRVKD